MAELTGDPPVVASSRRTVPAYLKRLVAAALSAAYSAAERAVEDGYVE